MTSSKKIHLIVILSFLTFIVGIPVYAQVRLESRGLGASDADWKAGFGAPKPFERDVWIYQNGHYYTRAWYRKGAPSGRDWPGYFPENYYVKYIEIVWDRKKAVTWRGAKKEVRKLLPADSIAVSSVRSGKNKSDFYTSNFLANRIFPLTAGMNDCVTPWGFGVGKFRVTYIATKGRVVKAIIDIGKPHETSPDVCKN